LIENYKTNQKFFWITLLFVQYHLESDVWSHIMMVFSHTLNSNVSKELQVAALLHDIGKPLAKVYKNDKIYFNGHEGISTHLALRYKDAIEEICDFKRVLYIINYHGVTWQKSPKQISKYFKNDVDLFSDIYEFNKYDRMGNISFDREKENQEFNFFIKDNFKETDKTIYMMIGLPNSGKSTFVKENFDLPILSRDDILIELGNGLSYNDAWKSIDQKEVDKIFEERKREFKNYNEFVIDLTNLSWKSRAKWFNYYKNYKFKLYVFLTDIDTIFERNNQREGKHIPENVIVNMMKRTELPLKGEGNIEEIIFIKDKI